MNTDCTNAAKEAVERYIALERAERAALAQSAKPGKRRNEAKREQDFEEYDRAAQAREDFLRELGIET